MKRIAPFFIFFFSFFTLFAQLSPLATKPDWSLLNRYQKSLSREQFENLVKTHYSRDKTFFRYCRFQDQKSVTLYQDLNHTQPLWTFYFNPKSQPLCTPRQSSLKNLVIALDPGHLGGEWARLEERYFRIGNDPPIKEWNLNVLTCHLIEFLLKKEGAKVVWVKKNSEPVTPLRPKDLWGEAFNSLVEDKLLKPNTRTLENLLVRKKIEECANRLFYRVAEIRARAERVNRNLKPDLTLCIHYNADEWGDPLNPTLVKKNRLVLFTHGAYMADELRYEDHKFHLTQKLLEGSRNIEEAIAINIAKQYQRTWPWPPEPYPNAPNVIRNPKNFYVFDRNLLASRLYHGPVVFCEGPYMNANDTYPRLIAGDYNGIRLIRGKRYRSIFREYAENVVAGIKNYYNN
ncbi:MAG: hypothetical protein K1X66_06490 [Verrucomicrobiae bacterium]|nr:hypothetical protein [Verrucomicrobiae bacterium]